ncbi:MAG: DNA gyrase subunit A [Bacteroidetes bacterium]|mgnify:CR=1 FL=1|jgi:DNA gyrase subunit A|nr:DNA gyrase subunit A [Bacteroidota bacterium]MBT5529605.1 DNA gyrase subunit A [Cytophagia bacterium]MBT3422060.1 DNA gyrase subunit A [Bacteroidota bacterium]MBT3802400.1 DNA gyrase subunit A [Bacteroidota bacterium]MBT4339989.1 DNA gyrase subunit A [Bacteroidota bacterium]
MGEFQGRVITVDVNEQMKSAYIDYSMSVIVSRALPDARDGLKPVHRRVLFGMRELGVLHNRSYKKSARIVGEVLGKYHPHGDTSVYDTMVRMAQPWSLRYPLVDGQGNFGSVDGDSPAAMRYTEARLKRIAEELLIDLEKDTVDFRPNFDESLTEPTVLPARFPNLLVNGASGIAVGMATNMAPHNLTEVINGTLEYIDNSEITIEELMKFIKAPDFPTGGIIYGYTGVKEAFETGRGRIVMRAKAVIEEKENGRERIIVSEIPYLVNKASMIMKTADLVMDKVIDGISDIRDESDRDGMRIVYELKREANSQVVLNTLFKYTQLQSSFSVNSIALVKNRPRNLNLKDLISVYVEHRHEVVVKRTEYELKEAQKRAHILEGLIIAVDNIDEVIAIIRASKTPDEAKAGLIAKFELSDLQSKAILEMRLQRLTGLEIDKLRAEYAELMDIINRLKEILASKEIRMQIIKDELLEIKERYGDERRTEIQHSAEDIDIKDIIPNEEVVITISNNGYIKRTVLTDYRTQHRGGRGAKAANKRDNDFFKHIFISKTHNYLLLFTDQGKCYWLNVYEIPEGEKATKGRPIQNVVQLQKDETIKAFVSVEDIKDEEYLNNTYIVFATRKGIIKKTTLEAYSRPRQGGIIAITINEGDELIEALKTDGNSFLMLGSNYGQSIRFHETQVRPMGRGAAGVIGLRLSTKFEDDFVIGMLAVQDTTDTIMVVSENGYGKRSAVEDYRITKRGGKGIRTLNITEKTGKLVAIGNVTEEEQLMIVTRSGIAIRMKISNVRTMGRATQGVRLIKIHEGDDVASVARIVAGEFEEEVEDENADLVVDMNEQQSEESPEIIEDENESETETDEDEVEENDEAIDE